MNMCFKSNETKVASYLSFNSALCIAPLLFKKFSFILSSERDVYTKFAGSRFTYSLSNTHINWIVNYPARFICPTPFKGFRG